MQLVKLTEKLPTLMGFLQVFYPIKNSLHPEDTKVCIGYGCIEGGTEGHSQHTPSVPGVYDSIIPQSGTGEVRRAFVFKPLNDGLLQGILFFCCELQCTFVCVHLNIKIRTNMLRIMFMNQTGNVV